MKEFGIGVLVWLAFILVPVYFAWMLACIAQGDWITLSIFDWPARTRVSVVLWTIFVTMGAVVALKEI